MRRNTLISILMAAMALLLLAACQSAPTFIEDNLSEQELIQLAQDSYDDGNTAAAESYYQAIIDRYGDNSEARVIALFEIAHIRVKDEDWNAARPLLEEIIGMYEDQSLAASLPEYYKLAQIDLAKLPD